MRRSWLLSKLSLRLDYRSSDENRLLALLELEDEQLIEAVAGRRRNELKARWRRFELGEPEPGRSDHHGKPGQATPVEEELEACKLDIKPQVETVCRHCRDYPRMLGERRGAPKMLHVVGGRERLQTMSTEPAVAIVGSERPTDYGMEMARGLARGLAASGVTIVSGLANGIAAAALAGALEVAGPTVTVMAGGVDVVKPAGRRGLYERVSASGALWRSSSVGLRRVAGAGRRAPGRSWDSLG